jgi:DNA-binding transcriptional LysR family regulator
VRLQQLQQFITLAKRGNFRKASNELGISQSALTRSIQNLEQYFNAPLFDRLSSGVTLTVYGRSVLTWAEEVINSSQNIRRYLSMLKNGETGTFVVGAGAFLSHSFLALALSKVLNRYPNTKIKIVRDSGQNAESMILNRQVDVFLGWIDPILETGTIRTHSFEIGSIAMFCRKGHPLTQIPEPEICEILKYPFVGPIVPKRVQPKADRIRMEYTGEDRPLIDIEIDSYSEIKTLVENSDCVGSLPEYAVNGFLEVGGIVRLPVDLPRVSGVSGISYLEGERLPPVTEHLIEQLLLVVENHLEKPVAAVKF